jgi:hypothetical protein
MSEDTYDRPSRMTTARTRGALTGLGLMLLGAWGAVIPFVGPYFDYAYTPNSTWTWTAARFWLQVLPGVVTFLAGLLLLTTRHRVVASFAAWVAVLAGAWYVIGPLLAPVWRSHYLGTPVGGTRDAAVEAIGLFYGLGAAIILLGAFAAGRFSVLAARDVAAAQTLPATPTETEPDYRRLASPGPVAADSPPLSEENTFEPTRADDAVPADDGTVATDSAAPADGTLPTDSAAPTRFSRP